MGQGLPAWGATAPHRFRQSAATSPPPHASSWAAPPEFYIDENKSGRSLWRLLRELGYVVHTPTSVFGRERLEQTLEDEDWLPVVGANGWVVFGRDQHILDRERELQAYLAAKIHMFMLPGSATRDRILALVGANLQQICTLAVARQSNVYWREESAVVPYEKRRTRLMGRRKSGLGP